MARKRILDFFVALSLYPALPVSSFALSWILDFILVFVFPLVERYDGCNVVCGGWLWLEKVFLENLSAPPNSKYVPCGHEHWVRGWDIDGYLNPASTWQHQRERQERSQFQVINTFVFIIKEHVWLFRQMHALLPFVLLLVKWCRFSFVILIRVAMF